jgi:hypothetical protein
MSLEKSLESLEVRPRSRNARRSETGVLQIRCHQICLTMTSLEALSSLLSWKSTQP